MIKVVPLKSKSFKYRLIVIDGFLGSGKTLIAPIISSYKNSQNQSISYDFENVIILNYLKKINNLSAKVFLKLIAEENLFNYEIGRKLNLRIFDHTGPKFNPKINEDLKKINNNYENKVLKTIDKKNKIINFVSHKTFLNIKILNETFGKNFLMILCVRHPLFLFRHYFNFYKRLKKTPKDFTLNIKYENKIFPWFYYKLLNQTNNNLGDNILNLICYLLKEIKKIKKNKNVNVINFEDFVIDPKKFLISIENKIFLSRDEKRLKKMLKFCGIPRKNINQGISHVKYGLKKTKLDNKKIYLRELNFFKKNISKQNYPKLERLIKKYNKKWPNIFNDYA